MARSRLGEHLVKTGALDAAGLRKALAMQSEFGGRLGSNLLELGLVGEETLLAALGELRATRTVSSHQLLRIPPEVLRLVPPKLARRYRIVPVQVRGSSLLIASMDPGDALIEDEIGSLTSCLTRTVLGLEVRVQAALERDYGAPQSIRLGALARRLERGTAARPVPPEAGATSSLSLEVPPAAEQPRRPAAARPRAAAAPPTPPGAAAETASADRGGEDSLDDSTSLFPAAAREAAEEATGDARSAAAATRRRRRRPPPRYIELDEEDRALLYPEEDRQSPEWRLETCSEALQKAEIRDEVADQVLAFSAPYLRRRLLLIRRKDQVVGWRGEGEGMEERRLRAIVIPLDEPSVFHNLRAGAPFWRGPLPAEPAHQLLALGLGAPVTACVVMPIAVRDRIACFLFGDNLDDGVGSVPLTALQRLTRKAGVAFEVALLKNKIRIL